jgi:hypothetical protein
MQEFFQEEIEMKKKEYQLLDQVIREHLEQFFERV